MGKDRKCGLIYKGIFGIAFLINIYVGLAVAVKTSTHLCSGRVTEVYVEGGQNVIKFCRKKVTVY
jgi:hypothetical protein